MFGDIVRIMGKQFVFVMMFAGMSFGVLGTMEAVQYMIGQKSDPTAMIYIGPVLLGIAVVIGLIVWFDEGDDDE